LREILSLAWRIRRRAPDAVYALTSERGPRQLLRDRLFFRLAGVGDRYIEPEPFDRRGRSARPLPEKVPEWLRLLRVVDGSRIAADFRLEIPEAAAREAEAELRRLGVPRGLRLVAIGAGSKMPAKIWPGERFAELGARLLDAFPDAGLAVLGGPEDGAKGDALCDGWGPRAFNFAGRLSLYGSAALSARCVGYVGNDGGLMHLAAMAGARCVALFSARDFPGLWRPMGEGHALLRHDLDCAGCMQEICPRANACMEGIAVEEVFLRASQLLRDAALGRASAAAKFVAGPRKPALLRKGRPAAVA
jgi:ADP-heptose:LPS heptosyltransferase